MSAYFDAATASPLHPVAREAMIAALADGWADPERLYSQARRARQLLDAARGAIAEALAVRDDEVIFTSSGSDAVHRAVNGSIAGQGRSGGTVASSAVEHSAVLRAAATRGAGRSRTVGVDRLGRVDLDAFAAAVRLPDTVLAALQSANHEVGTEQPVAAAAELCADVGVPLLVDAAQSVGRIPVPPGWSMLTASARKWGGPPGVGVLAVRKGVRYLPPGPAPGPVDLPAVVAAAAALRAVMASAAVDSARLSALVTRIREGVAATVPDVELVGDPDRRLPHIVTFSCLYVDGETLTHALDRAGFAVSSGSACTADTLQPSHVLAAMGALTHGNVRISLHTGVDAADVDRFLAVLPGLVADLRTTAGVIGL
jgi:cysteine desulfurase